MNPTVTKSVDGFFTQDMAKIGHRTLTKGQSNKITDQFSTELFSVKQVIKILQSEDMKHPYPPNQ